jgi:hypothetical protein
MLPRIAAEKAMASARRVRAGPAKLRGGTVRGKRTPMRRGDE